MTFDLSQTEWALGYAQAPPESIRQDSSLPREVVQQRLMEPTSRAAKNFKAMDYCGEVAKTKKSSASLWLTTTAE